MADSLKLSVVTPEGSLFSGEATFVAAPAASLGTKWAYFPATPR